MFYGVHLSTNVMINQVLFRSLQTCHTAEKTPERQRRYSHNTLNDFSLSLWRRGFMHAYTHLFLHIYMCMYMYLNKHVYMYKYGYMYYSIMYTYMYMYVYVVL